MLKSDSTVDGSKVQNYKVQLLAITFTGTNAIRLAITFNGTDSCKVPEFLLQPIYIEEHISSIQESEFQERKRIGNSMADYF